MSYEFAPGPYSPITLSKCSACTCQAGLSLAGAADLYDLNTGWLVTADLGHVALPAPVPSIGSALSCRDSWNPSCPAVLPTLCPTLAKMGQVQALFFTLLLAELLTCPQFSILWHPFLLSPPFLFAFLLYLIFSATAGVCCSHLCPRQAQQHWFPIATHASPPTPRPLPQDVTIQR